jgi:hypothetical protein
VADGTNQLALEVEGASVARPFLLQWWLLIQHVG